VTQPVFVSVQTSAFSGATLLAFLLGAHPAVATVGEMSGLIARENPETYLCSCGQRIRDCRFWRAVTAEMWARGHTFDVAHFDTDLAFGGPPSLQALRRVTLFSRPLDALRDRLALAWPGERRRTEALVARNLALVESVLAVTGKRVFVDTSKDRLRLGALRRFSHADVRAIHLVRDVRGVVASRIQRGGASPDAREAARQWARLHRRLQASLDVLPAEKRLRVRYEDLCADAPATLARVFAFCGVDPAAAGPLGDATQHIVGNPMRLGSVGEIRPDERWRDLLSGEQMRDIQAAAGRLSRQFGYGG
jgi:hypothetical protein